MVKNLLETGTPFNYLSVNFDKSKDSDILNAEMLPLEVSEDDQIESEDSTWEDEK